MMPLFVRFSPVKVSCALKPSIRSLLSVGPGDPGSISRELLTQSELGGIEVKRILELRNRSQTCPNPIYLARGDGLELNLSTLLGDMIFSFASVLECLRGPTFAVS
jgi:hypothetical protein